METRTDKPKFHWTLYAAGVCIIAGCFGLFICLILLIFCHCIKDPITNHRKHHEEALEIFLVRMGCSGRNHLVLYSHFKNESMIYLLTKDSTL